MTTLAATSVWGESAVLDAGWRLPFLPALPLGIAAVLLRSSISESPSFEAVVEKTEQEEFNPIFERHNLPNIRKYYWPQILMGIATVHTAGATVAYLLLQGVLITFVAHWSDRIGRKPIYVMATVGKLVLRLPAFALVHMGQLCASASATPVPAGSQGTADLAKE